MTGDAPTGTRAGNTGDMRTVSRHGAGLQGDGMRDHPVILRRLRVSYGKRAFNFVIRAFVLLSTSFARTRWPR